MQLKKLESYLGVKLFDRSLRRVTPTPVGREILRAARAIVEEPEKHLLVRDGQVVSKGEMIVDGPADPHDPLRLLGVEELTRYIVDEVQDVYRLQGVKINDKHIEVIVRQMLRRVEVTDPGETSCITGSSRKKPTCWRRTRRRRKKARSPLPSSTCCSASPRRRYRPIRSSPRLLSRRPRGC
jgi:hypothetical protein